MLDTQSFLRKFFDAFYKELLEQKYRASTSHQRPDASQAERGDAAHGLVESIATQLISLLDAQQAQVMQQGGGLCANVVQRCAVYHGGFSRRIFS